MNIVRCRILDVGLTLDQEDTIYTTIMYVPMYILTDQPYTTGPTLVIWSPLVFWDFFGIMRPILMNVIW